MAQLPTLRCQTFEGTYVHDDAYSDSSAFSNIEEF